MSAQVEEVTASAPSLAEMAEALQQVVAQFKLSTQPQARKEKLATVKPVMFRSATAPAFHRSNSHRQKYKKYHEVWLYTADPNRTS
jgi:hypothetical protein